jgi:pullulanase-type alpha-1,6-glucosidase
MVIGMFATPAAAPRTALASEVVEPGRVTVPGSFNEEIGCTGDWQPGCISGAGTTPATPEPNDLLSQGNGVWARTLGPIPAGSYEYKVALNGSWDENYGAGGARNGPNLALSIGDAQPVRFYYDHKTKYIANNVTSAIFTVPGNFNSEIGCAGDWQPECLRTLMSDADGDGIFTFVTDNIPPGSYEFKVATNESWSNPNYGIGGGGANVPFTVVVGGLPVTFSFNRNTSTPSVEVALPPPPPPEDAALVRPPASDPANQDEVFYFVLPDRFANGSAANDTGGIAGGELAHGFKPDNSGYYHGGDLAGLRQKLPYLKQLGVTAIWMTPVFKNRAVQCDPKQAPSIASCSAGYHGYWITDFTQIDPHIGTNQELKDLIAEAQGQGMRVFFDIITNHTADVIDYEGGNYDYVTRQDAPYRDAGGNIIDDRDYLDAPAFPELNRYSFPRRPIFRTPADATVKAPAWLNDVTMYHNRGNANFDGTESDIYGDFVGLDGIFTERPEVVAGMIDIYKYWIREFGVDGFRVDTVKHVNNEFWQKFVPAIRSYAATRGKPNFFIFGEVFSGDPAYLSSFTRDAAFPAVLDFDFNYSAGDFAVGSRGPDRLQGLFRGDDYYTTADQNAYNLPTFLGNHDIGRIGNRMRTPQDAADADRVARMALGYGLMFTARGVPIIYYGDEQGFTGDGNDKDARQDMFPSQVASYNDDDLIGTNATTADDNFDTTHPLYQALSNLAALRKAHPALQSGSQIERLVQGGNAGVYAFSRIDRSEKIEYIVALNNATDARNVSIQTFAPAGMSFDAIYGATGSVNTDGAGRIGIDVPRLGMVVYKQTTPAPAPGGSGGYGPIATISAPADGATVDPGMLEVAATVVGNAMTEVSFWVSVDGGTYTYLGTDTNAPYRIFYDTSKLPGGTAISFKAVTTDVLGPAGNFFSATTAVTTATPPICTVQYQYAIVHYHRPDGNYDGWTVYPFGAGVAGSYDYNTTSIPFSGRTNYGAFAWIPLSDPTKPVGMVIHNNASGSDIKDPNADLFFTPADNPQVFVRSGNTTVFPTRAAADGYVTFHYNRPDGDYSNTVLYAFGAALDPAELVEHPLDEYPGDRFFSNSDGYGRSVTVRVSDPTKQLGFIVIKNGVKDPDGDRFITPAETPEVWLKSGDARVYRSLSEAENVVRLRYHRPAGDYGNYASSNFNDFWGLHLWNGTLTPNPAWQEPLKPNLPQDSFGIGFRVPLSPNAQTWNYILHRGDTKDKAADQLLLLGETGHEIWILQNMPGDYPYLLPVEPGCKLGQGNITAKQRAHWVSEQTIAWPIVASPELSYTLHYAPGGGMSIVNGAVQGGASIPLTLYPGGLSADEVQRFPHLADLTALRLSANASTIKSILTGQIWVEARSAELGLVEVTGVQIPGVLDDLYAEAAARLTFGPILPKGWDNPRRPQGPTLRLWAPTAQSVKLRIFEDATSAAYTTVAMTRDDASGAWSANLGAADVGKYYLYEVDVFVGSTGRVEKNLVTDPYSVSLATNSTHSQIVDLAADALKPAGWDKLKKPRLNSFEDIVLYELHVRDFSITDASVPPAHRGTFMAFTNPSSNGMQRLRELANDGLTHVHLLPAFDIATIEEEASKRTELLNRFDELRGYAPDGTQQQAITAGVRDLDGFNWGYDPYHYNVPEGSYSTDPNGAARIREFRAMVDGLSQAGLRVVMDVVYNHTAAAGQNEKSVLDRIVPGYYHRLNADGVIETSTCCQNTATEHAMMEKLMVDSLVQWAKAYKVDGFRFDLMGHHMKANMLRARAALDALTVAKDGVDGRKIVIYGEGWNFGEVANGQRGINATQRNMAGTGIATFSDRLRDAVRGGGPFDSGEGARRQGFINGLYYDPNGLWQGTPEEQRAALLRLTDMIKVGMAGNLASYTIVDSQGRTMRGEDVDYNGSPGGYTKDPQEVVTYIEAHDNETLFDALQVKAPASASLADRVRMQNMGISIVMLSQGMPFFQAGQEMLRSKSGDRNSYNSGDWFNRIDWTMQENGWGSGLPLEGENASNWGVLRPVLANPALKPGNAEMVNAYEHFREMLRIRKSTPLFRLRSAAEVEQLVKFYNNGPDQIPGLIVMEICDIGARDIDPKLEGVVALFNASDAPVTISVAELAGAKLRLHPVQRSSHDPAIAGASFDRATGTFTIPARTTVVYIQ